MEHVAFHLERKHRFSHLITKNICSVFLKEWSSNAISNMIIPCHSFTLNRILAIHFYALGFDIQEKGLVTLAYRESKTKGFGHFLIYFFPLLLDLGQKPKAE